jgi:hypothetical protein
MSVFPFDITGTAPTFKGPGSDELNGELDKAFKDALGDIRGEVGGISSNPEKFIQAWGNSAVFASHGATQRAYGGYQLFAFTVGPMIGFQIPGSPLDIVNNFEGIADKIDKEGDMKLGLNLQMLSGQLGINTSKFLVNNLYLGVRVGYMNLEALNWDSLLEEYLRGFTFNTWSLGLLANYQLLPRISLAGLLQWRGINLGTGFIFQSTNASYTMELPTVDNPIGTVGELTDLRLEIKPKLTFDMDIKTFTIPLEVFTSVRLGLVNLGMGMGIDVGFGKSDMKIGVKGDIDVKGDTPGLTPDKTGNISATEGGDMAPSLFNPKVMADLGFSLGPVLVDIPVTFYLSNGYNIGVTLGILW